MKKMKKSITVACLLLAGGCNYPTPKMACGDELETLAVECSGSMFLYSRSHSTLMENASLLMCAQYVNKKAECDKETF